jgi:hypothetical protein
MPLVAKVSEPTHVILGNKVFDLSDGERQVTKQEAATLERVLKRRVSIEDTKPSRKEKS